MTRAADMMFDPAQAIYRPGQEVAVKVLLNTSGESLNAVEAEINYPAAYLQFIDASDANSILNLWPQKSEEKNGKIYFAGIVTGGYKGEKGLLLTLFFKTIKEGDRNNLFISNASVLKNDGNGTPAKLSLERMIFKVKELGDNYQYTGAGYQPSVSTDTKPPENFFPQIARNENIFGGKWFVAFNAQDKGSGIDHYEIQENSTAKPESDKWKTASSPYLLKDQHLRSYIFIKAVDKAGNSMLEIISPRYEKKKISPIWYAEGVIIALIIVLLYIRRRVDGK